MEALLQAPIAELGPGYTLPPGLAADGTPDEGQGGGGDAAVPVEYGAKVRGDAAGGEDRARMAEHVKRLRPAVQELAGLEFEAQNIWLGLVHGRF